MHVLHIGAMSVNYSAYMKSGCVRKVSGRLQHKFQDVAVPNRKLFLQSKNK
jgi:hypothetical protein